LASKKKVIAAPSRLWAFLEEKEKEKRREREEEENENGNKKKKRKEISKGKKETRPRQDRGMI